MYDRILVTIDDSETTDTVVNAVVSTGMARSDCKITLLQVLREVDTLNGEVGRVTALLEQTHRRLLENDIESETILRRGDPAQEICRYVEDEHIQLVIIGNRDHGLLEKLFIGDVSQKVAQEAPSNVLVVK